MSNPENYPGDMPEQKPSEDGSETLPFGAEDLLSSVPPQQTIGEIACVNGLESGAIDDFPVGPRPPDGPRISIDKLA